MVRDFFDVVLGVADPNVFVVPEGCKPRPPKPPPGPSPPHSVCTPALEKACGPLEHKGKTCTDCTARNAASLRAAGCTAAIEAAFCKAPPHTACTPALDKACAPVEHKGQPCFACVARNKAALIKAGCTPTAEGAFCSLAPTPSPSPPKPPAPSPPHSVCRPALEKACGDDEHKGAVCTACITRNKATLTHAGCTAAMETVFCAKPTACGAGDYCCPAVKACVEPQMEGKTLESCDPLNPNHKCGGEAVCCPLTKMCVVPASKCVPPPVCGDKAFCSDGHCRTRVANPDPDAKPFCTSSTECQLVTGGTCDPTIKQCVVTGPACTL